MTKNNGRKRRSTVPPSCLPWRAALEAGILHMRTLGYLKILQECLSYINSSRFCPDICTPRLQNFRVYFCRRRDLSPSCALKVTKVRVISIPAWQYYWANDIFLMRFSLPSLVARDGRFELRNETFCERSMTYLRMIQILWSFHSRDLFAETLLVLCQLKVAET